MYKNCSCLHFSQFTSLNFSKFKKLEWVGSMVEWLEHWDCNQNGLHSKPTHAILLCLEKTLYSTFPCLVVLASSFKF